MGTYVQGYGIYCNERRDEVISSGDGIRCAVYAAVAAAVVQLLIYCNSPFIVPCRSIIDDNIPQMIYHCRLLSWPNGFIGTTLSIMLQPLRAA